MRRGFTIIELLVASALLGMLVTILTMIFNQSSIAWRVGVAGVSDLGDSRYAIGTVREIADNAFIHSSGGHNHGHRIIGLWDKDGKLRNRACDAEGVRDFTKLHTTTEWFFNLQQSLSVSGDIALDDFKLKNVGGSSGSSGSFDAFIVNVKSAGPDKVMGTWDDIWSLPDDWNEWCDL